MKVQVLLPKVFNYPFTYYSNISQIKTGDLVQVPFGSKKEIGVVWKNTYSEPKNIKIKSIEKKINYSIDKKLVNFIEWFSTYNIVPIGLVLKMAIGANMNFVKNNDKINTLDKIKSKNFKLNNEQLSNNAQQSLIREKIKKDEIDKFYEIDYSKAINSQKMEIIVENFRQNIGFNSNEEFMIYLENKNIKFDELKKKFVIEQLWNTLIIDKYRNLVNVDSNKINDKLEKFIKNNSEILSFNLSEIIFLEKDKAAIDKKYNEIISSIKSIGFKDTAVIYSMSESAKLGGGIGWVNQNQISKKVFLAIKDLKIGEFSDPIITAGGIILLNVNAKKNVDTEINKEEEMKRLITFEQNRILNEYSMIYYKEIENKAYVEKF